MSVRTAIRSRSSVVTMETELDLPGCAACLGFHRKYVYVFDGSNKRVAFSLHNRNRVHAFHQRRKLRAILPASDIIECIHDMSLACTSHDQNVGSVGPYCWLLSWFGN